MKKDYFLNSKIVLGLNAALSIAAFVMQKVDPSGLGLLLGAALVSSLCTCPKKAFRVCLPVQLALLTALMLGVGVWFLCAAFFLAFPPLLLWLKDADRVAFLISYSLALLLPPIGIAAALGVEKIISLF